MCPPDEDPPRDQGSDPAPKREHGASPVVQRPRNILGTILGVMGICVAVAFLFLTGSHKTKPQPQAKPVIAANGDAALPPALADQPPQMPDHERITFPGEVPNNPQHYGPGQTESAEAERQKAEARRHSPMLIYDSSGKEEAPAPAKPVQPDALNTLLASQLQNAATNPGEAEDRRKDRDSPAEGYAERTQAFAHAAADEQVPEATARRITLYNRIAQGKMVPAILETAINSDLPGKLRAIVSQDVWSEDGGRQLIRRGSRLYGEYRSGLARGQTRVFVIWTRLLEPDGTDLAIGSPGTDDLGRAGLTGAIDRHFAERFGAAFLLSLIGSATTASQGGNTFIINTSQGFGQVAQESLQDSINIPPTIYVDQGTPVQVFVARDLIFDLPPPAEAAR